MPKAITNIKHGNEDGSVTEFEAGEEVSGLPDDVMDDLYASGAVAEETPDEEANRLRVEELENEILRLRRELGQEVPSPGEAAEDVMDDAAGDDADPNKEPSFDPDANPQ